MFIAHALFVHLTLTHYNANNLYKEASHYNIYKSIYPLNMLEKHTKKQRIDMTVYTLSSFEITLMHGEFN